MGTDCSVDALIQCHEHIAQTCNWGAGLLQLSNDLQQYLHRKVEGDIGHGIGPCRPHGILLEAKSYLVAR